MDKEQGKAGSSCIHKALAEVMKLQEFINQASIPYFGKVFSKLVGVDTIPIMVYTEEGTLTFTGVDRDPGGEAASFETSYLRMEDLDETGGCARVSLLRPLCICGRHGHSCCDILMLKRTGICVNVDVSCLCAVQFMDINLLKRKIVIEPKW
ncbi:CotY/CotZ family spore coat protein [Lysinibacillus sphaericus]